MSSTEAPTHVAVIGTAASVVAGEFCDVSVTEADEHVTIGGEGDEHIEYLMTDRVTLRPVETSVRAGGNDGDGDVLAEADQILRDNGYRRVGDWEHSDNAVYANVVVA